uniref:Secreted protein n=1 Tax=Rhipicephalus appendiculatus TaxID=34631 RepID=A0A131YBC8_RHIAP
MKISCILRFLIVSVLLLSTIHEGRLYVLRGTCLKHKGSRVQHKRRLCGRLALSTPRSTPPPRPPPFPYPPFRPPGRKAALTQKKKISHLGKAAA